MIMRSFLSIALFSALFCVSAAAQEAGDPGAPAVRTINGGVVNGKATNLVKPAYPKAAMAAGAGGAVNVQVTIDEEGNVISATAVSGHPLLRAAAVEAARQSKFSPTILSGQPARVTGVIVYNFDPKSSSKYGNVAQMVVPFGIPMVLSFSKINDQNDENRKVYSNLAKAVPSNLPETRNSLLQVSRARTKAERNELIDSFIDDFVGMFSGTDLWLAEIGRAWGNSLGAAFVYTGDGSKANLRAFQNHVADINELLANPPEGISNDLVEIMKEIASFDDDSYARSGEFVADFRQKSLGLIDSLFNSK